jgi:type III secretion protein S
MELATLVTYVKQALLMVLWLSLLQAVTQVQDQTISFGIKLLAAMLAIALTSMWLGGELMNFANQLFDSIQNIR